MRKSSRKMELLGVLLGNALEFYDFTVYAFMAPFIKKHIFPFQDDLHGLLLIFSIFSSGYFVRPIGSILFGHIGDKYSRDRALILSVTMVTISTLAIGFVPSYELWGGYSVVMLLVLRMVQGLAVSGEEGGSTIRIYETLLPKNKGLAASLVISTVFFGVFIGSLVCYWVSTLIERGFVSESFWRTPFILALPLGLTTLYIRIKNRKNKTEKISELAYPIKGLFNREGAFGLISCYSIGVIFSILTSVLFIYVPYFLKSVILIPSDQTLYIVSCGILLSTLFAPIFGYLSDNYSEEVILKVGLTSSLIFISTVFPLLQISYALGMVVLFFAYISMALTVPMTFSKMLDVFDKPFRYTGMSLALNMAVATFSGTLPVLLIYLTSCGSLAVGLLIASLLVIFYFMHCISENLKKYRGQYEGV